MSRDDQGAADDIRERNLATLQAGFEAIGRSDVDALVESYTDDYVLELPFADTASGVRVEGREAVRSYLEQAFTVFRFTLEVTEIHETGDPDFLIAEYVSSGEALTTGRPYANRYIGLWRFRDGKVSFTREFYNPVAGMKALKG